ncbi:MAG: right-handed parallel beta-helix repeat-containing protein [Chthoniobacterales bacterium]
MSKTAPGGEISVLDPGGFGSITINKSLTINGTGTLAGILAASVNGVVVNAGANDTIILRDIAINGANTGLNGIRFIAGGSLVVDHCSINGFRGSTTSRGIDVSLNTTGNLKVYNSVVENILEDGIHMTTTAGQVVATIDNTEIMNCGQNGIDAANNVRGAISRTRITHDPAGGIVTSGSNSILNLNDVFVSYATVGLQSSSGSAIRVSNSTIAQNSTGLSPNGGSIDSFQGNSLIGNPTPGSFSSTTQKQ